MVIRIAIIGLGNCASALVQGLEYYRTHVADEGLMTPFVGGYSPRDIDVAVAFDVDKRKVYTPVSKAIFAKPNCCYQMVSSVPFTEAPVLMAPILDGVAQHMYTHPDKSATFEVSDMKPFCNTPEEAAKVLKEYKVDVLINYLPVGSTNASHFWAETALLSKTPFLNCIPVFIASNPEWARRFTEANVPIMGDDMKSQFGASVLSQMFEELATVRGHTVVSHIQQNSGGNTDFLNMMDKTRILDKKISKENVIRNASKDAHFLHAGPSDYISFLGDTKVAHFNLSMKGFGGSPVTLDAKLVVQDSPNSAGVVIDAIRYLKTAKDRGLGGPLEGPSAFTQKSPPLPMPLSTAIEKCKDFLQ